MKILKKLVNNKKSLLLIAAIVVVAILVLIRSGNSQPIDGTDELATTTATVVETISLMAGGNQSSFSTNGLVESEAQAVLTAEAAGIVEYVGVEIGDAVADGALLVRLSADDEQAALAQAEANLLGQEARLTELKAGARPTDLSTAQANLRQARTNLFNTDLQAYLVDEDVSASGSLEQPAISGTYQGSEAGEYRLSLYQSGSQSGVSFRYEGLETGIGTASSEAPQPLGARGLYIEFPEDFAANPNVEWVVPVPNTRSSQYSQAKTNVEQAENNLANAESGARDEQVQAQEAVVAQAAAGVAAARSQLAKKLVRTPFSGEVVAVDVSLGERVSPGQAVVEVVNTNNLQITTSVPGAAAGSIAVGDTALIDNRFSGEVFAISPAISETTGKVGVKVRVTDSVAELVVGDFVSVEITASGNGNGEITVPLSAIKHDTQGAYVLRISDEARAERVAVETGSLHGDSVVITSGPSNTDTIIRDIRSISVGEAVEVQ